MLNKNFEYCAKIKLLNEFLIESYEFYARLSGNGCPPRRPAPACCLLEVV